MKIQTLIEQKVDNLQHYLACLISQSMEKGYQIAVWRKPHASFLEILIDKSGQTKRVDIHNLEELGPGFIAHPFEDQEDEKGFYIEADTYLKIDILKPLAEQEEVLETLPKIISREKCNSIISNSFVPEEKTSYLKISEECTRNEFIQLVDKGIAAIKTGTLNKIVPARIKKKDSQRTLTLFMYLKV